MAVGTGVSVASWSAPVVAASPVPVDVCARAGACGTIVGPVRVAGQRTPLADTAVIAVPASSKRLRASADP
ncbi:MAG TPA: hypothetical protein VGB85_02075, partial [Nannocystis sp.]